MQFAIGDVCTEECNPTIIGEVPVQIQCNQHMRYLVAVVGWGMVFEYEAKLFRRLHKQPVLSINFHTPSVY